MSLIVQKYGGTSVGNPERFSATRRKRVVLADAVFEVDPVTEELRLRLVDTHHTQDRIVAATVLFNDSPNKCDLGNRPKRCAP